MPDSDDALNTADSMPLSVDDFDDPILLIERVYHLLTKWAFFHLFVITPNIPPLKPPMLIEPEPIEGSNEYEFVYPILDHGYKLSMTRAPDAIGSGLSLCKAYYTIEKMIFLLMERLKSGGVDAETEVQISFGGHEYMKRKAFESVINLAENVVVTNFEPGTWGEQYLKTVKLLAEKGYGYPSQTPRDNFKQSHASGAKTRIR